MQSSRLGFRIFTPETRVRFPALRISFASYTFFQGKRNLLGVHRSFSLMNKSSPAEGIPLPKPGECNFYLKKKRRYCTFPVQEGELFCSMHNTKNTQKGSERKRIPCPLDPRQFSFSLLAFSSFILHVRTSVRFTRINYELI